MTTGTWLTVTRTDLAALVGVLEGIARDLHRVVHLLEGAEAGSCPLCGRKPKDGQELEEHLTDFHSAYAMAKFIARGAGRGES